jgi:hypothetical protein
VSAATPDDLLAEARRLDGEAANVGEDGPKGRELRGQAAALRVEALGPRPYPVVVCAGCFRLTGWTTAEQQCDACARRAALRAARAASGGWLPNRPPPAAGGPSLRTRLSGRTRGRGARAEAAAHAWLARVDPGETGPIDPEQGYELEGAVRDEVERVDAAGVLVRFATATERFADGEWVRLPTTRIGRSLLPYPTEFAADVPVQMLVEAWTDYQAAVTAVNRARWHAIAAARDADLTRREQRERALREQAHTAELLDE